MSKFINYNSPKINLRVELDNQVKFEIKKLYLVVPLWAPMLNEILQGLKMFKHFLTAILC